MAKKKFLGLQYPIVKTPRGLLAQKSGVDQIKADLLQLLLTNPGERVMLPEYGTPLRELFFEPNDETLGARAQQMIVDSLLKWEPRIVATQVQVNVPIQKEDMHPLDTREEQEAVLNIKISFVDPENISEVEHLTLEVPTGG